MFLNRIPKNFRREKEKLGLKKINSWEGIKQLSDDEILNLVRDEYCSSRNLRRLRCIALLVCELKLSENEAALLMHSGIASIKALLNLTPQELFLKTGRFERLIKTGREPVISLKRASELIRKAKIRQNIK
ncbi:MULTISPECIES: DUF4332 domain-containing protein [Prochlorococcus]|uniref:DUF4332 domain-containing protein n=1 Tax=Prochlorococcus TaxID=1218 RepID=UPI00055C5805|nr:MULTISPECIES: DUF4332 domain-containing protein [Prochlorococcus]